METRTEAGHYRADIDAMRAVAVTAVVLFHFNPAIAPSGFLGVDVFFVISGFVVTAATLRHATDNSIEDIKGFWRRRFFRIFPALLVCVFAATVFIAVFIPPFPTESYTGIARTGLLALFGASNLYLVRLATDYFAADQSFNLFLHTWSLGIEEQFYLIFTLLLMVVFRRALRGKAAQATVFFIVMIGSFSALAITLKLGLANLAFYSIAGRLWELQVGACLAVLPIATILHPRAFRYRRALSVLAWAGLIAIIAFLRSGFALTSVIGAVACTAVLIALGASASGATMARPLVQVGQASYSIYLWHWPILVGLGAIIRVPEPYYSSGALALLALASIASFRFIERPWRGPFGRSRAGLASILLVFSLTVGGLIAIQAAPGALYAGSTQKWHDDWLPDPDFPYVGPDKVTRRACSLSNGSSVPAKIPDSCDQSRGLRKLLVVGDSHAFADWGMAAYGSGEKTFDLATLVHVGCSAGIPIAERWTSCREYWRAVPSYIEALRRGDLVLMSIILTDDDRALAAADQEIERLAAAAAAVGATLIVEAPLPMFPTPAFLCSREWFRLDYRGCTVTKEEFENRRANALKLLRSAEQSLSNVIVWDPSGYLCEAGCSQFSGSRPLFWDGSHLSFAGSRQLGPAFVRFVESRP